MRPLPSESVHDTAIVIVTYTCNGSESTTVAIHDSEPEVIITIIHYE